ncbi:Uma2 family endonuclease [Spirosoma validum]|uniref:Uma2 family endonuclease n=1 Tax=Spirosoma validum TaxID=2771355 RepID=A0A927GBS3_9BACT|nr:Uma2 family endonuclease [Spirosoma validum]MBD2751913.1 Uma2 family endonuclease [Spirosoma validum]
MEAVAPKIPITLQERDEAPDIIRVSATWEEYLELAEVVPYNIDYYEGEIISIGQASLLHEGLVSRLIALLSIYYDNLDDYTVLASNVKIFVPDCQSEFNADLSVLKGSPDYLKLPSGRLSTVSYKNPEVIVEVLSKSTKNFDKAGKLDCYKTISSLQYVLFVDQSKMAVSVVARTTEPNQWLTTDYNSPDDTVRLGDLALTLRSIYRKTPLAG